MAKPEWGTKRECLKCGARYYDLRRDPIVCPKCDSVYEAEPAKGKARAAAEDAAPAAVKPEVVAKPAKKKAKAVDPPASEGGAAEIEEVEGGDAAATDEENIIEDASELGEDAEDVVVPIEDKPEKGPD